MKSRIIPYVQTGLAGARWLRDDAELSGVTARDYVRNSHWREAGLVVTRNALQKLPAFDVRDSGDRVLHDNFKLVGIGSEAVVVRNGPDSVYKYLTGKSQKPETLRPRLQDLLDRSRQYLGGYLPETDVDVKKIKLLKGITEREYVRLKQPYIAIEHVDPHLNRALLEERPDIAESIRDFSEKLFALFENEGVLMDIVNEGNLVWGKVGEQESGLYLLDTIGVDYDEPDFTGIKVPFWSPDMHLEYLASFIEAAHPEGFFTESMTEEWES